MSGASTGFLSAAWRRAEARPLVAVFAAALAVRLVYIVAVTAASGADGFMIDDSAMYIGLAQAMAGGEGGFDPERMPLYTFYLVPHVAAVPDPYLPLAVALSQSVLDACTCVVVALLAGRVAPGCGLYAGLVAAVTPTLFVLSGLVLTDTLFTFFAALSLWAGIWWYQRPGYRPALVLGAALAAAAATRVMILPWAAVLLAALLAVALLRRGGGLTRAAQPLAAAAILALPLVLVGAHNHAAHGTFGLTSQSGTHLLGWVVPLVMEARDGTPHEAGARRMSEAFAARRPDAGSLDPFERSAAKSEFAGKMLAELGPAPIVEAWTLGAAINLGSPAILQVPPVAALPRTGFYDTPGDTKLDKIARFLFANDNPLYAWLMLAGAAGVAAVRLLQLYGLVWLWRRRPGARPVVVGLLAWVAFLLAVAGPVAAPKYRLPAEPVLALLAGAALMRLHRGREVTGVETRSGPAA